MLRHSTASLCCASVLGQWQSPRSLVTLEKNDLMKNLLASSKAERKRSWLSKSTQRGEKIEPINVHKHAYNSEDWHFCRLIPCCSRYTISSFSSRRTIHTKTNTPTDMTARYNTLARTPTFKFVSSGTNLSVNLYGGLRAFYFLGCDMCSSTYCCFSMATLSVFYIVDTEKCIWTLQKWMYCYVSVATM
jgi:hypothetical protein